MPGFISLLFLVIGVVTSCTTQKESTPPNFAVVKRHFLPDVIDESSGLIAYNDLLWTFNDSGGKPELYGFDVNSDSIKQIVFLKDAINKDWEDIAQDQDFIYVGDFGNNMGTRDTLTIYRIKKSEIGTSSKETVAADKIKFTYPDYTPAKLAVSFSAYDCEAFVVVDDELYLFSKDWINGTCTIYNLPKDPGTWKAKKVTKFNSQGLITGADFRNGKLLLIGYRNFIPFIWQFTTNNFFSLTEKNGRRFDLQQIATYQTEGICFDGDRIYISSEKTRSPAQILEITVP